LQSYKNIGHKFLGTSGNSLKQKYSQHENGKFPEQKTVTVNNKNSVI